MGYGDFGFALDEDAVRDLCGMVEELSGEVLSVLDGFQEEIAAQIADADYEKLVRAVDGILDLYQESVLGELKTAVQDKWEETMETYAADMEMGEESRIVAAEMEDVLYGIFETKVENRIREIRVSGNTGASAPDFENTREIMRNAVAKIEDLSENVIREAKQRGEENGFYRLMIPVLEIYCHGICAYFAQAEKRLGNLQGIWLEKMGAARSEAGNQERFRELAEAFGSDEPAVSETDAPVPGIPTPPLGSDVPISEPDTPAPGSDMHDTEGNAPAPGNNVNDAEGNAPAPGTDAHDAEGNAPAPGTDAHDTEEEEKKEREENRREAIWEAFRAAVKAGGSVTAWKREKSLITGFKIAKHVLHFVAKTAESFFPEISEDINENPNANGNPNTNEESPSGMPENSGTTGEAQSGETAKNKVKNWLKEAFRHMYKVNTFKIQLWDLSEETGIPPLDWERLALSERAGRWAKDREKNGKAAGYRKGDYVKQAEALGSIAEDVIKMIGTVPSVTIKTPLSLFKLLPPVFDMAEQLVKINQIQYRKLEKEYGPEVETKDLKKAHGMITRSLHRAIEAGKEKRWVKISIVLSKIAAGLIEADDDWVEAIDGEEDENIVERFARGIFKDYGRPGNFKG